MYHFTYFQASPSAVRFFSFGSILVHLHSCTCANLVVRVYFSDIYLFFTTLFTVNCCKSHIFAVIKQILTLFWLKSRPLLFLYCILYSFLLPFPAFCPPVCCSCKLDSVCSRALAAASEKYEDEQVWNCRLFAAEQFTGVGDSRILELWFFLPNSSYSS